jgi:hypothetical protein
LSAQDRTITNAKSRPVVSTASTIKQAAVRVTAVLRDDVAWERAEAATALVDRWIWTAPGAQLGRLQPGHRDRDPGSQPVELLDAQPDVLQDEEQYGLAADGTVLVHREWVAGLGPRVYSYDRTGPDVIVFRWGLDGNRCGVELLRALPGGRLAHAVDVNADGECFAERYDWDEDALRAVELLAVSSSARLQARRVRVTDRVVYEGRR